MAKKNLIGIVIQNNQKKSCVISYTHFFSHIKYLKIIKKNKTLTAHNSFENLKVGNIVLLKYSRPISKTKTWLINKIIF